MGIGYTSRNDLLNGASQVVAASQTKQVISTGIRISAEDSMAFRAEVTAASTTGTVTIMLETTFDLKNGPWTAGKAVTVADGQVAILYNPAVAGDQAYLPLPTYGRLSVTTAAASGTTITACTVAKRL